MDDLQFTVKVVVNSEKTKVLFAEVDGNFADIMLSFLTLPLGEILRLFEKHYGETAPVVGSLNSLYKGLGSLDDSCFWTKEGKHMLLNPRNFFSNQYSTILGFEPGKYFRCSGCGNYRGCHDNASLYYPNYGRCGGCKSIMDRDRGTVSKNAVFTVQSTRFLISDDMRMVPLSESILENLFKLGITDTNGIEERTVQFGLNEIMGLLKGLMLSRTPLTDLILNDGHTNSFMAKNDTSISPHIDKKEASSCPSKMFVVVVLQKSTNKLLFAHANEQFVDFLFGLLVFPLGSVADLLYCSSGLGGLDNLHGSISSFNCTTQLKGEEIKAMLLKPTLAPKYGSKCQILPVEEENLCNLLGSNTKILDPKGDMGCYVKEPHLFMVTDDLTVTRLSAASMMSRLNMLQIPLSDVEEVKVEIGVKEALAILKASLTTTRVLRNALKPVLDKLKALA